MSELKRDETPEDPGLLHIYGQACYHDEAYMVGNTKGLKAIRDAIDTVLNGEAGQSSVWVSVSDAEGYDLKVLKVDDRWSIKYEFDEDGEIKSWSWDAPAESRWNRIAVPYTDEDWGREHRDEAQWPAKFWRYEEPLPPTTGTVAAYVAEYLCKDASELPLVEEGVDVKCPHCGKTHPSYVIDGKEGERLLIYVCQETHGQNELIAGFSEGDRFRLATSILK